MMRFVRHLTACLGLLLASSLAAAQAYDGDWVSYRDAYRAMVVFEKYGGAKNLLQQQLQLVAKDQGAAEGLRVTLAGKSTQLKLQLDATGRMVLPLLKAAYDENAALLMNRQSGPILMRPRLSILVRPDGIYDTGELRAACEQALAYARYTDRSLGARQCAAVRFVFPKDADASVRMRRGERGESMLPVVEGVAFNGDAAGAFPTVTYRLGGSERGQVVTNSAPLAIVPLFE